MVLLDEDALDYSKVKPINGIVGTAFDEADEFSDKPKKFTRTNGVRARVRDPNVVGPKYGVTGEEWKAMTKGQKMALIRRMSPSNYSEKMIKQIEEKYRMPIEKWKALSKAERNRIKGNYFAHRKKEQSRITSINQVC